LQQEQVETATKPCHTLDELSAQIRAARSAAAAAAADAGAALVPLGTSPLAVEPTITPSRRYAEMARRFGLTVAEGLTCGCHVHVAVDSPDEGVAVLDRIRPWLAPLLALSVNSPFWNGEDSGYRSFRTQVWQRWPVAGPYARFGSAAAYREFVDTALATDTLLDEGMVYLAARLARNLPTVEVRVADVCLEPDDAVLVAGLVRALVQTAADAAARGTEPDPVRTEVLHLAESRPRRCGTEAAPLPPRPSRPAPPPGLIDPRRAGCSTRWSRTSAPPSRTPATCTRCANSSTPCCAGAPAPAGSATPWPGRATSAPWPSTRCTGRGSHPGGSDERRARRSRRGYAAAAAARARRLCGTSNRLPYLRASSSARATKPATPPG